MPKSHLEATTSSVAALLADPTCSPVNGQSYKCLTENELKDKIMTEEFKKKETE